MARKQNGKEGYSVDLPPDVIKEWDKTCEELGLVKYRAVTAAFKMLQWAPPDLRELVVKGDIDAVGAWYQHARVSIARAQAFDLMKENLQSQGEGRSGGRRRNTGGKG